METKLIRYVPDEELFVNVSQVNGMIVCVIGKVNSSGRQSVTSTVNVLQVLANAGGLNTFAKRKKLCFSGKQGPRPSF